MTSDEEEESNTTHLSFSTICKYTTFFRYKKLNKISLIKIFFSFFRELIADHTLKQTEGGKKIGGEGMTVEIYESLFGKR